MAVVCSQKKQFAKVDHIEATGFIKLGKDEFGHPHYIPFD